MSSREYDLIVPTEFNMYSTLLRHTKFISCFFYANETDLYVTYF